MNDIVAPRRKALTITHWVLRLLLAAFFLFFASMKLTGAPFMVKEFEIVGLGQWLRYFTGTLEVIGGIAILIPRFSTIGAAVLLFVDLGAFGASALVLPYAEYVHIIVVALLLAAVIYLNRQDGRYRGLRTASATV